MAQRKSGKSTIGQNPLAAMASAESSDPAVHDAAGAMAPAAPEAVDAEPSIAAASAVETTSSDAAPVESKAPAETAPVEAAPIDSAAPIETTPSGEAETFTTLDGTVLDEDLLFETAPRPAPLTAEAARARRNQAIRVVRRYVGLSSAAGLLLLPVPGLDVTGAAAVQVKMLHTIARLYGVAFDKKLARHLIVALIGGGGSMMLALPMASAAKALPVVGTVAGVLLTPTLAGASCYATGHAFVRHFDAGGTLETFNPKASGAAEAQATAP